MPPRNKVRDLRMQNVDRRASKIASQLHDRCIVIKTDKLPEDVDAGRVHRFVNRLYPVSQREGEINGVTVMGDEIVICLDSVPDGTIMEDIRAKLKSVVDEDRIKEE